MTTVKGFSKLPVLIIGYSREVGVRKLLESINPLEVDTIHLAIDGSESLVIKQAQIAIVDVVTEFCEVNSIPLKVWVRKENLGVAVSIITAIDWFFSDVPFGIILEDDLLLGDDFFEFSRKGLELIQANHDVLLVSGDFFLTGIESHSPAFLTNYPLIWGWATNSQKWSQIRAGILSQRKLTSLIGFNQKKNFWRVGTFRVLRGQIDTWDIPFADFMISRNKFCLFPSTNLVSNNGNDAFAIHTVNQEFPMNLPTSNWSFDSKIELEGLFSDSKAVNLDLEKGVYRIRIRHSFLGIFYFLRLILGFEKGHLEGLRARVNKTPMPVSN